MLNYFVIKAVSTVMMSTKDNMIVKIVKPVKSQLQFKMQLKIARPDHDLQVIRLMVSFLLQFFGTKKVNIKAFKNP